MAAEAVNHTKPSLRKPTRTLWVLTLLVIAYVVWCALLCALTASGHLVKRQTLECGDNTETSISLEKEAILVYVCASVSLLACISLLAAIWIRRDKVLVMLLIATTILVLTMISSFIKTWQRDAEETQAFKEYYLALIPLAGRSPDSIIINCRSLSNVQRWQAEFKCCGLESYQDWGSQFPASCLCEGKDNSSGCVGVGGSLVYEKPCLPTVLSLVGKRNTVFWLVMIVWIIFVCVPVALSMVVPLYGIWFCFDSIICEQCCFSFDVWRHEKRGREEMVQVVFLKKDARTEKENRKDWEAKESGKDDRTVREEGREGTDMTAIPLSLLRRLQRELDPPPVEHILRCACLGPGKPGRFHAVVIEEGSPLLPSSAAFSDANQPPFRCLWTREPHIFKVQHTFLPPGRAPRGPPPSYV